MLRMLRKPRDSSTSSVARLKPLYGGSSLFIVTAMSMIGEGVCASCLNHRKFL